MPTKSFHNESKNIPRPTLLLLSSAASSTTTHGFPRFYNCVWFDEGYQSEIRAETAWLFKQSAQPKQQRKLAISFRRKSSIDATFGFDSRGAITAHM
jgi:hypothetical protein